MRAHGLDALCGVVKSESVAFPDGDRRVRLDGVLLERRGGVSEIERDRRSGERGLGVALLRTAAEG
jgi:hypothetical protein